MCQSIKKGVLADNNYELFRIKGKSNFICCEAKRPINNMSLSKICLFHKKSKYIWNRSVTLTYSKQRFYISKLPTGISSESRMPCYINNKYIHWGLLLSKRQSTSN